eukprot:gene57169-biopygen96010
MGIDVAVNVQSMLSDAAIYLPKWNFTIQRVPTTQTPGSMGERMDYELAPDQMYNDLVAYQRDFEYNRDLVALCCFLTWLRMLEYSRLDSRLSMVIETVRLGAQALFGLGVVLCMLFFAFFATAWLVLLNVVIGVVSAAFEEVRKSGSDTSWSVDSFYGEWSGLFQEDSEDIRNCMECSCCADQQETNYCCHCCQDDGKSLGCDGSDGGSDRGICCKKTDTTCALCCGTCCGWLCNCYHRRCRLWSCWCKANPETSNEDNMRRRLRSQIRAADELLLRAPPAARASRALRALSRARALRARA